MWFWKTEPSPFVFFVPDAEIINPQTDQVQTAAVVLRYAEILGIEYQQGTLIGYELCKSLLEKWPPMRLLRCQKLPAQCSGSQALHLGHPRQTGSSAGNQNSKAIVVQGISHKHYRVIQRADWLWLFLQPGQQQDVNRQAPKPETLRVLRATYLA